MGLYQKYSNSFTKGSRMTDQIQDDYEFVSKAQDAYDTCTPAQKLWVLKNRAHWLFMPGCVDKELVKKSILELELVIGRTEITDLFQLKVTS